jgi:protein SCO1/2
MQIRRSLPWLVLLGVLAIVGGALLARMLAHPAVTIETGTWLPESRAVGSLHLTDAAGKSFTEQSLQGHPSLVFFGFTYCPDLCPTTLSTLAQLQRDPPIRGLEVLFITVDPERDSSAALQQYLAAFSPDFVGLRPQPAELPTLLRNFGAIAERVSLPDGSYTVDHSATLYLLDTRGRIAAIFTPPFTAAGLHADLARVGAAAVL